MKATLELNETNYCDQKPVTMEFSFKEHDLLNEVLNHAISAYDFMGFYEIDMLSDYSEVKQRYDMLMKMREHSYNVWSYRFGNPPYNN